MPMITMAEAMRGKVRVGHGKQRDEDRMHCWNGERRSCCSSIPIGS